jgi:hypothetical protein
MSSTSASRAILSRRASPTLRSARITWVTPRMALRGVRISWLVVARNSVRAFRALSSAAFEA